MTPTKGSGATHKIVRAAAFVLPALALMAGSIYLFGQPNKEFVARLQPNTDVLLEYTGSYIEKKSPTCGCMLAGADEWRGVSFLSRRIEVGPTQGTKPVTSSYMISAAFPSTIKPYSTGFLVAPRHLVLEVPEGKIFEARAVANGMAEGLGYRIIKDEQVPLAPTVTIISPGPLFEETLGEVPEGTWIPSRNGQLRITKGAQHSGQSVLTESFNHLRNPNDPSEVKDFNTAGDVFSIVDLIGPKLIVWVSSPTLLYGGKSFKSYTLPSAAKVVDALIFDVSFALRTTLGGIEDLDLGSLAQQPYIADSLMVDPIATGEASIKLDAVDGSPIDQAEVKSYARGHALINACGPSTVGQSGHLCVKSREPPAPGVDTTNIFGQVQRIHFAGVSGNMMIGSRHFDINPSVPVDLIQVNSFDTPLGDGIIPIWVGDGALSVDGRFAAKGAVTVNGEPLIRRIDHWSQSAGALALILSLGSLARWVWASAVKAQTDGSKVPKIPRTRKRRP